MDLRKKALALNALTAARTRGSQVLLPAAAAEAKLTAAAASSSSRAGAGTAEELKSSPVGRSESSGTRKVELGRTRESEVVMAAEDWNQGSGDGSRG